MENKHTEKCGFELNHQDECVFPPQEPIPCCFSEVNELGKHITNCNNLPIKLDEDNIQVRYFCEEHMKIVENIRRKMAQKYIKEYKEKLLEYINTKIKDLTPLETISKWAFRYKQGLEKLKSLIEVGTFDND